jgi:hypothetical protein
MSKVEVEHETGGSPGVTEKATFKYLFKRCLCSNILKLDIP